MPTKSDGDPDMSEFVLAKVEIEETAATIAAARDYIEPAVTAIKATRAEIERKIRRDDFFLTTLEPYNPKDDDGRVIHKMCKASSMAGVGPMATVAGTIAQEAMEAMVSEGCTHGWVDNGGDIALLLESAGTVEIFSEPDSGSACALELEPTDTIIGICTSSGRLGHSISLGNSDATVAVADNAILADALATAIGNRIAGTDSLKTCFDPFKGIEGFIAGLAMIDGSVSIHGRLPKLVEIDHRQERLTTHSKMSTPKFIGSHDNSPEVRT
jgi:ApbE superfamily uncharacterized protein (UPF0280 family)